jgi:hypothetical protein
MCQVNRLLPMSSSFEGVANGGDSAVGLAGWVIVGLLSVHQDAGIRVAEGYAGGKRGTPEVIKPYG